MKLVILDCDGTIVDSQNGICEAMSYTFSRLGLAPPTRAQTLAVVGLSLAEAFAILAHGHDDAVLAQLAEQYRTAFRELKRDPAHHEPLFEGMASVIEQFSSRDDLILGIATGSRAVVSIACLSGKGGLSISIPFRPPMTTPPNRTRQ